MSDDCEIERKFLVNTGLLPKANGRHIVQGFISVEKGANIMIRVCEDDGHALLVIKGEVNGITRSEAIYEIPLNEGRAMLLLCERKPIEKIRYDLEYKGHKWIVDEFLGDNKGLWLAEIELEDQNEAFEKPSWAGHDVSYDKRYYNAYLFMNPYKNWKPDAQKPDLKFG